MFWIAEDPTADSVRIHLGQTMVTNTIPEYRIKDMKNEANDSVVFSLVLNWEPGSDMEKEFGKISEGAPLSIELMRANKPVSNLFRVELVDVNAPPK